MVVSGLFPSTSSHYIGLSTSYSLHGPRNSRLLRLCGCVSADCQLSSCCYYCDVYSALLTVDVGWSGGSGVGWIETTMDILRTCHQNLPAFSAKNNLQATCLTTTACRTTAALLRSKKGCIRMHFMSHLTSSNIIQRCYPMSETMHGEAGFRLSNVENLAVFSLSHCVTMLRMIVRCMSQDCWRSKVAPHSVVATDS